MANCWLPNAFQKNTPILNIYSTKIRDKLMISRKNTYFILFSLILNLNLEEIRIFF